MARTALVGAFDPVQRSSACVSREVGGVDSSVADRSASEISRSPLLSSVRQGETSRGRDVPPPLSRMRLGRHQVAASVVSLGLRNVIVASYRGRSFLRAVDRKVLGGCAARYSMHPEHGVQRVWGPAAVRPMCRVRSGDGSTGRRQ